MFLSLNCYVSCQIFHKNEVASSSNKAKSSLKYMIVMQTYIKFEALIKLTCSSGC